jgi:hypothetical protein
VVTFNFVRGRDFRAVLEADHAELVACIGAGAWKAAHVLAGSIVEALLVDYIAGTDIPERLKVDPLSLDLGSAIKLAKEEKILSDRVVALSEVVRQYRNLIHPGRVVRLEVSADEEGARVALSLVNMVAREVAGSAIARRGYTAEQLATKVRVDPSSVSILSHLLGDVSDEERRRVLMEVVPREVNDAVVASEFDVAERLGTLYRVAFDSATVELKGQAASRYVTVLREEGQALVYAEETALLRAPDIQYLSDADASLVKAHLLERLTTERTLPLLRAAQGISPYLTQQELSDLVDIVVREIAYGTDLGLDRGARDLLEDVYRNQSTDADHVMVARLDDWIPFLKEQGPEGTADSVSELSAKYAPPPVTLKAEAPTEGAEGTEAESAALETEDG